MSVSNYIDESAWEQCQDNVGGAYLSQQSEEEEGTIDISGGFSVASKPTWNGFTGDFNLRVTEGPDRESVLSGTFTAPRCD